MNVPPEHRVILVTFHTEYQFKAYEKVVGRARAKCLVYKCELPGILPTKRPSLVGRVFRRKPQAEMSSTSIVEDAYLSEVQAARQFVVDNYRRGDHVMVFASPSYESIESPWYIAIQQLLKILNVGSSKDAPSSGSERNRILIRCLYIDFWAVERLEWSELDQILADFSEPVNVLCATRFKAYVTQRGSCDQIQRQEAWMCSHFTEWARLDWLMLQTCHFINFAPSDLVDPNQPAALVGGMSQPRMVSKVTQPNCTKRKHGEPSDDSVTIGGQLIRVSKITRPEFRGDTGEIVVWSSQYFTNDDYDDVCRAPLAGPKPL